MGEWTISSVKATILHKKEINKICSLIKNIRDECWYFLKV